MMNFLKLDQLLVNEPVYRRQQINKLIFQDLIDNWRAGTTLPKTLREMLNREVSLAINAQEFISKDGTVKALITLGDGLKIETVLMRLKDRHTVCISSQVGCPLGCLFCATGQMGFKRNLDRDEILDQVLYFARRLKKEKAKITNIVFMGMGEPFLNYDNVVQSIKALNNPAMFGLGARHIAVSTAGLPEEIGKFGNEGWEVNLAISLHAANDGLRSQLMPINQKYPLAVVMAAVKNYLRKTHRKVMFEYLLLGGVNDSDQDALDLCRLLTNPIFHLNLIQYNPTGQFKPSSRERVEAFKKILTTNHVSFTERYRFGLDIKAACGQLATQP